jgi:hypothetical protein
MPGTVGVDGAGPGILPVAEPFDAAFPVLTESAPIGSVIFVQQPSPPVGFFEGEDLIGYQVVGNADVGPGVMELPTGEPRLITAGTPARDAAPLAGPTLGSPNVLAQPGTEASSTRAQTTALAPAGERPASGDTSPLAVTPTTVRGRERLPSTGDPRLPFEFLAPLALVGVGRLLRRHARR